MAVAYGTAGTLAGVTSGNITLAAPASIADGDLLIAVICANDTVTVSRTGWNAYDNVSATSDTFKTSVLWRIASGESGSYIFTHTGGSFCEGQVFRVTGTDQTTPIVASSKKGSSVSGTSITSNTCTPTVDNCLIFWAIGIDDNIVRVSAEAGGSLTWTERVDAGNSTAALGICVATAPQTTAAGLSPTATFSANNTFAALVLAIQPPVATGAISGTAGLTFSQSGTLTGAGALSGSSALSFGQSATVTGAGVLAGSGGLVFAQTGVLTGSGALSGASALTFGTSGSIGGSGALTGSSALLFSSSGTLAGLGALLGTSALTFGASGTLDQPSGAMSGTASLSFDASGSLSADGSLSGIAALLFDAFGTLDQPIITQPGPLDSPRIAEGYYRRKPKQRKADRLPERERVLPELRAPVVEHAPLIAPLRAPRTLVQQVDMRAIDQEIASLLHAISERDDEEAFITLLTALED